MATFDFATDLEERISSCIFSVDITSDFEHIALFGIAANRKFLPQDLDV